MIGLGEHFISEIFIGAKVESEGKSIARVQIRDFDVLQCAHGLWEYVVLNTGTAAIGVGYSLVHHVQ